MIIVNFEGGLGNQMFQYAAGLAVAKNIGSSIKCTLDLLGSHRTKRIYELYDVFGVEISVASSQELSLLLGPMRKNKQVRKVLAKPSAKFLRNKFFISDDHSVFVENLASHCISGAYLHGYWQSEKYFKGAEQSIQSCFTFPTLGNDNDLRIVNEMSGCYSIGVHVRRGDYLASSQSGSIHNVLPLSYYKSAINRLHTEQPDAKLFVFSDDINWARQHIQPLSTKTVFVNHNQGKTAFRDMQLLALCDAIITANSSFSWWAAWLNSKSHKRIIAPNKWFSQDRMSSENILPPTWEAMG